ncbi:MAG: Flp pilus assembly protein CpaB [Bacteriovorax sp.]|nr:Flp pilus assembly protein CpaB [Bacteriovorax sp.]
MNTRALTLALVIAGFAMMMVYTYIEDQRSAMIKDYGTQSSVVVAKVDIQELDLIDDSKIEVKTVPENFLAPGHFKSIKDLENTIATVPIIKGEQITKPRVTYPGIKTGLSRQISVGKRAVAINITERDAVGRLIKPGDRVDVLAAIDISQGARKDMGRSRTILQDVLVLSTGMSMTNSIPMYGVETPKVIRTMNLNTYTSYNTITLELDPYDVQKLSFIQAFGSGTLSLALRNNADKEPVRLKATQIYDVLGEDAPEAKIFFNDKYTKDKNNAQ